VYHLVRTATLTDDSLRGGFVFGDDDTALATPEVSPVTDLIAVDM
jgi:hypothetical protein